MHEIYQAFRIIHFHFSLNKSCLNAWMPESSGTTHNISSRFTIHAQMCLCVCVCLLMYVLYLNGLYYYTLHIAIQTFISLIASQIDKLKKTTTTTTNKPILGPYTYIYVMYMKRSDETNTFSTFAHAHIEWRWFVLLQKLPLILDILLLERHIVVISCFSFDTISFSHENALTQNSD